MCTNYNRQCALFVVINEGIPEARVRVRRTAVITYFGRSGSYLLSNLLDGHPQVLSLPPHSFSGFFKETDRFLSRWTGGGPDVVTRFVLETFPYLSRDANHNRKLRLPDGVRLDYGVPTEAFADLLMAIILKTMADKAVSPSEFMGVLFIAVHVAYAACRGRPIPEDPVIAFQLHAPEFRPLRSLIRAALGNVVFIKCVRQPEKTIDSYIAHYMDEIDQPPCSDLFVPSKMILETLATDHIDPDESKDSIAVRFEDMHRRTEALTRAVARELGIDWHPIVLETTLDGQPFYFSSRGTLITGTRPELADGSTLKYLDQADAMKILIAMRANCEAWGYEAILPGRDMPVLFQRPLQAHWVALRRTVDCLLRRDPSRDAAQLRSEQHEIMLREAARVNAALLERATGEKVTLPRLLSIS
ncbi:MAG: sulfotransferase [Alphaproteobacteria bacterium]